MQLPLIGTQDDCVAAELEAALILFRTHKPGQGLNPGNMDEHALRIGTGDQTLQEEGLTAPKGSVELLIPGGEV